jgi:hypothetical protein
MKSIRKISFIITVIITLFVLSGCPDLFNNPPVVTKISGKTGTVIEITNTFNWDGSDSDGTIDHYEYRKDYGIWTNNGLSKSYTWNGYSGGDHTFEVRAQDNESTYSEVISWQFNYLVKKILIDNTHGNENYYDGYTKENFFGTLIGELESMYHTVDFTSEVGFIPSQYDILILDAPFSAYTYSEEDKVYSFLQNGGTLVALGEKAAGYWNNSYLNNMLSYLGVDIRFEANFIYDYVNYYEEYHWPKITDFFSHPTTNSLDSIVLFAACTLDVFGDAEVVAESSTVNVTEPFNVKSDSSDSASVISKGMEVDPQVSITVPIIGVDYVGSGKVIAIPDVNIFGDDVYGDINGNFIDVDDNMQLLMNIIYW